MKGIVILKEWLEQTGVYPVPHGLSTTSVLKGWLVCALFMMLSIINMVFFDFFAWIVAWILPQSTVDAISQLLISLYWMLFQYLVSKKKIKIVISGVNLKDPLTQEQLLNSIVMSNHRSVFDYLLINYLKTLVERATGESIALNFFSWNTIWAIPLKRQFKSIIKNDENWSMNKINLKTEVNTLLTKNKNNWLVHFPEVNIFDEKIKIIQHQQADLNYLPKYNELLYPRFRNFTNIIQSQQNASHTSFGTLLDLTVLYYHPIKESFINPTILEILTVKQPILVVHIDFKLKSIAKLPTKPRKLEKWLEDDWIEKDRMIEAVKKQLKITR